MSISKEIVYRYTIDYEYGVANLYTPSKQWERRFNELASQCFGIRKAIGEITLLNQLEGQAFVTFPEEYERLEHSGDVIVWNEQGNKIKSEWEDVDEY